MATQKSGGRKTVAKGSVARKSSRRARSDMANADRASEPCGATHEEIARRAYELFVQRGCQDGHHLDDWLMAETELQASGMVVPLA
ncbi:MAG: DUF2934 domain-containing protein [Deltaproteobacteria bacterium]|nr:DUF2934 domain-containing protein [Deltaproteobacteria bacterium]